MDRRKSTLEKRGKAPGAKKAPRSAQRGKRSMDREISSGADFADQVGARLLTIKLRWENAEEDGVRAGDRVRRNVYDLGNELRQTFGNQASIAGLHQMQRNRNTRARPQGEIYRSLMGLLFTHGELSRSEQHRYAYELTYAWWHGVPTELLMGFILQVAAGKDIKQKVESNAREPWYRHRMALVWEYCGLRGRVPLGGL